MAKSSNPLDQLTKFISKNPLLVLALGVGGYFAVKKIRESQGTKVAGYPLLP